jgi:hypothetical protein
MYEPIIYLYLYLYYNIPVSKVGDEKFFFRIIMLRK